MKKINVVLPATLAVFAPNVLLAAEVWDLKPKCVSLNESS